MVGSFGPPCREGKHGLLKRYNVALKVGMTVADFTGSEKIEADQASEAIKYRSGWAATW